MALHYFAGHYVGRPTRTVRHRPSPPIHSETQVSTLATGMSNSSVRRALASSPSRSDGRLLQRIIASPLPVSSRGDKYERRAEHRLRGHQAPGAGDVVERLTTQTGQTLPATQRRAIEARLGDELGDVRFHKDSESVQAAAMLGAEAFTHGRDVYLGASAQLTNIDLLAHEAAHALDNQDAVQRREATWVERRAWLGFFDHYLPRKFLNNYMDDTGTPITLTKQEMEDCNAIGVDIRRSGDFQDALTRLKAAGGGVEAISCSALAGALTNGTLGNFTVRYTGMLAVAPDDTWTFVGTITFHDFWDFNTGGANRPVLAEVKVRVANALLPGSPFDIDSVPVAAYQTDGDAAVQWDAAAPVHVPDNMRRGAVDIGVGGDIGGGGGDVVNPVVGAGGLDVGGEVGAQTNADF